MSVTPGRFSEFMVKGAETEPESLNPVYDEPAGIEQGESIPAGAELTTPTPTLQQNRQGIAAEPVDTWALAQDVAVKSGPAATIPGQYFPWDGSKNLQMQLAGNPAIRSIWLPLATGVPFAVYSGTSTGGAPIFSSNGNVTGVISIPDGITTLTFVPSGKFSTNVPIYGTGEVLPPHLENISSEFPIGATPFFINGGAQMWTTAGATFTANLPEMVIGQNVFLTGFIVRGHDRQTMRLDTFIEDAASIGIFNREDYAGEEIVETGVLMVGVRPATANGVAVLTVEAVDVSLIIGTLTVDILAWGYVL